jgi:uncharacterized membrane protein YdbT with pleckstrin-like domain
MALIFEKKAMTNQTFTYPHQDEIVFTTKPSNWINAPLYAVCLAVAIVFPFSLLLLAYKVIEIFCWKFEFRAQTIVEKQGVFSVKQTENHYFRIKSVSLEKPFLYRLVGLAILKIETSDYAKPQLILNGIANAEAVHHFLKQKTYEGRKTEKVREFDFLR